jgi:hypothetical protein
LKTVKGDGFSSSIGDKDRDLERVGNLERGKPIFLFIETLWHRQQGRFGVRVAQVRERRARNWRGHGRKGENPREVKTQERIGSNCRGKTRQLDARIPTLLKSLKSILCG